MAFEEGTMADFSSQIEGNVKNLRRYALALVGDPSDADDLVQETMKRALTYAQNGQKIRDLRAYLFTILHNVRLDNVMRANRAGLVVSLTDTAIQIPCPASQEARVRCRELSEALYRLSDEQRAVILLVALEGLSYQGAAEVLGIPIGTVMSRLNRGRAALKRSLGEMDTHAPSPGVQDTAYQREAV